MISKQASKRCRRHAGKQTKLCSYGTMKIAPFCHFGHLLASYLAFIGSAVDMLQEHLLASHLDFLFPRLPWEAVRYAVVLKHVSDL